MASSNIDKRIVEMNFDNSRFEQNINQSIDSLDRLKNALNMKGAANGFNQLERSINSIDLSGLERSISNIEYRFSTMGIVGMNIINKLTDKALGLISKVGSATFGQMKSGGIARALNLEHANFMLDGLLKDASRVQEIMGEGGPVQNAVKGTAYGLDAAANAAAQFVASGVTDLGKLENALTAISGAAAMTGSSYEDISRIFTTVAGNGRLMAVQMQQFSARGLNVAAALAEQLNVTEAEIRDMVSKGKIDFETFSDAMNKAFGDQAKKANKTFTGALSNVKAALSRIGAKVAQPTIEHLRRLFVALIPVIDQTSKTIQPLIDLINKVIEKGRKALQGILEQTEKIQEFVNHALGIFFIALDNILAVLAPIKQAFSDIFPAKTFDDVLSLCERFGELLAQFRISNESAEKLRRTFRGLFSIFDIVGQAVSAIFRAFFPSISTMKDFGSSVLDATAKIGDFIYNLSQSLRANRVFDKFMDNIKEKFNTLKDVISPAIDKIKEFAKAHIQFPDAGAFTTFVNGLKAGGDILGKIVGKIKDCLVGLWESLKKTFPFFSSIGSILVDGLKQLGQGLGDAFSGKGFDSLIALMNGGILAGIGVEISKFIKSFTGISQDVRKVSKLPGAISNLFYSMRDTFLEIQTTMKIQNLMTIAKAIGILALSLVALSLINPERLVGAVVTISILFKEIEIMAKSLSEIAKGKGVRNLGKISEALLSMGAAILLVSIALTKLSKIPADQMVTGLLAVTVLLAEFTAVAIALGKWGKKIKSGTASIIAFAIAVNIVASALKKLSDIPMEKLKVGIIGLSVVMGELAVAAAIMGKAKFGISQGAGILLMAAALKILVGVLNDFCNLPTENIGDGLGIMGVVLGEIAIFMLVVGNFAEHVLSASAALFIVSAGLVLISNALSTIASLGTGGMESVKVLGGALVIMTAALAVLGENAAGVLAGAASIFILAAALNLLLIPMTAFAAMGWNLVPAIIGLAAAVAAVAIPLALLSSLGPGLLIVGGAFALMGVGIAAVGAGIMAIATALSIIAVGGAGAIAVLAGMVDLIIMSIPAIGKGLAEMLMAFIVTLADGTVLIVDSVIKILGAILNAIVQMTPVLVQAIIALGMGIIEIVGTLVPPLVDTLLQVIVLFLQSLATYTPQIVEAGCDVITALIDGIVQKTPELVQSIFDLAIALMNGLADGLMNNEEAVYEAFDNLLNALLTTLGDWLPKILDKGVEIVQNLINGILSMVGELAKGGVELLGEFLKAIGVPEDIVDAGVQWVQGLIDGIVQGAKDLVNTVGDIAHQVIDKFKEVFEINSPSVVMTDCGADIDKGLEKGIKDNKDLPLNAMEAMGNELADKAAEKGADAGSRYVNAFNSIMSTLGLVDTPTQTPEQKEAFLAKQQELMQNRKNAGAKNIWNTQYGKKNAEALDKETSALGSNTKATGGNSKAKKENEKANDDKTKAIDEETESLEGEEEQTNETSEAIREMAEQIEVTTEEYNWLNHYIGLMTKTTGRLRRYQINSGKIWSGEYDNIGQITKAMKDLVKAIPTTVKASSRGLYKFADESKKVTNVALKGTKKYTKSLKNLKAMVEKTGQNFAKVAGDTVRVYYKAGNKVSSIAMNATKGLNKIPKMFKKAMNTIKYFQGDLNRIFESYEWSDEVISDLRKIEDSFGKVKFGKLDEGIQKYLRRIRDQFKELDPAIRQISRSLGGTYQVFSKNNRAATATMDALVSLGAVLYNGSEAANEYATQIAQLEFLAEHGEISWEEVEEARVAYLTRIKDALLEYKQALEQTYGAEIDMYKMFEKNQLEEGTNILKTQASNIAAYYTYGEMLTELSRRIPNLETGTQLVKQFADAGIDSFGKLEAVLKLNNDELQAFVYGIGVLNKTQEELSNKAFAAVANATSYASKREQARTKDIATKTTKYSAKVRKAIESDMYAMAQATTEYNNLFKKEEKEYLKTLTKSEKKQYKKYKKEFNYAKKKYNAQQKILANEEKVENVIGNIKDYKSYLEALGKYINDFESMSIISEKFAKAFESLSDVASGVSVEFGSANDALLAFANTLDATGESGLNFFEEMAKRIENFKDGIKNAVTTVNFLTEAFAKADKKLTLKSIYEDNILSQLSGNSEIISGLTKLKTMGYNNGVINMLKQLWDSDPAKARDYINILVSGTQDYINKMNGAYEGIAKQGEQLGTVWTQVLSASSNLTEDQRKAAIDQQKYTLNELTKNRQAAEQKVADTTAKITEKQNKIQQVKAEKRRKADLKATIAAGGKLTKAQEKEYKELLKKYGGTYKGVKYSAAYSALGTTEEELKTLRQQLAIEQAALSDAMAKESAKAAEIAKAETALAEYNAKMAKYIDEALGDAERKRWWDNNITSVKAMINGLKTLSKASKEYQMIMSAISAIELPFTGMYSARAMYNLDKYYQAIKNKAATEFSSSVINNFTDGLLRFGQTLVDAKEDVEDFYEALKSGLDEYQKTLKSTMASSSDFFSMFKGFADEESPLKSSDYLQYGASQIKALQEWQDNLAKITDMGLNKELVEKFASQGLGSYEEVAAWAQASAEEIKEYNGMWIKYQEQLEESTHSAMASIAAAYSEAGDSLANSMIKAFSDESFDRLKETGEQASGMIVTGIKDGLTNAMPEIVDKLVESDTENTMATKIGATVGAALNEGIVQAVSNSVEATVTAAIEKFKMAVNSINAYIDETLNDEWTINVHINTSEIDDAVARMNSAIYGINASAGATSAAVTSSISNNNPESFEPEVTNASPSVINLNYTQNNTSPKALSRPEIYRQTRNQLSTIESVIAATGG